jgi:hypothetical protein
MNEGRMTNKDGFYSMHTEVITEFSVNPSANANTDTLKIIREILATHRRGPNSHKFSVTSKKSKRQADED